MELYLIYIFKIILYYFLIYAAYRVALSKYKVGARFSWPSIILFSLAFGYYAILVGNPELSADRRNYAIRYVDPSWNDSQTESYGLNWTYEVLRPISLNPDFLCFSFEGCYIFLTLVVYRYYRNMHPKSLLILLCSLYPIFGFYGLKQAISQALVAIAFMIQFNNSDIKSDIPIKPRRKYLCLGLLSITFYVGAMLFHEAAYLPFVIFVAFFFWEIRLVRVLTLGGVFVGLIWGIVALNFFLNSVGQFSEVLSRQTEHYIEGVDGFNAGILTIFKGFPFYIISYIGIKYRKYYSNVMRDYDKYLLCTIFVSAMVLLSAINYWFFRFSLYFYFPTFIFAYNLRQEMLMRGYGVRWYGWVFAITLLLSIKEMIQFYFLYNGV